MTVLGGEGVGLPLLVLLGRDQAQLGGQLAHQSLGMVFSSESRSKLRVTR